MSNLAVDSNLKSDVRLSGGGIVRRAAYGAAIFLGILEAGWLLRLGTQYAPPAFGWLLLDIPLSVAAICVAWRFAVRHDRKWVRPARQLCELIDQVRAGRAPIEAISPLNGPIDPLARRVQELLRMLRQQKQELTALESDISRRVLHRTDALERVISTLRAKASRDSLTGLYNRRMLDEHLPRVLDQCRTDGVPLCILMMDLDHFKGLNDTLGHAAGDDLLRSVGQLIRSTCREGDLAFRNGGDEFVVLMPACEAAAAEGLARRVSSLVDQLVKSLCVSMKPGLSIGLACLRDLKGITPTHLLEQADAAMYERKAARKAAR